MAIPAEFSEVEHLQSLIRRYLNKQIRDEFQDLGGDDWEPDVTTTRGSMRYGLTHKDDDPMQVTLARMFLYYFTYGKAAALQTPIYGMPVLTFHELFKFHPQVRLYFYEDHSLVEDGFKSVEAEITFRLMGEKNSTITPAKAQILANKIKALFTSNNGFVWKKGREKWSYYDDENGYRLQLLAWNEAEAKKVIEQILDIQGHTPNWEAHLTIAKKQRTFPTIPGTHFLFGKTRRKTRDRPVAFVRFRYAELKIHGLFNDVTLVDMTGQRRKALIKA